MLKPKILCKALFADDTDLLAEVLLSSGQWDRLTYEERVAWLGEGVVYNSDAGRAFFSILKNLGAFNRK